MQRRAILVGATIASILVAWVIGVGTLEALDQPVSLRQLVLTVALATTMVTRILTAPHD